MVRAPNWSESEFEVVTNSYGLSDEELKKKLPRRSLGAIRIVRVGIHIFHTMGENRGGFLSQMMLDMLKKKQYLITCHECGKDF